MAAIITNKFRLQNAKSFMNASDNYYMFIGRPQPWSDEISPDTPIDSISDDFSIWDDMMSVKKISSSNMSHGIRKVTWTSGKYYDIYRHDYGHAGVNGLNIDTGAPASPAVTNLAEANYYVVTDNGNIYICIGNNNGGQSTESPDAVSADASYISTCADGYKWRKVAVTGGSDVVSFATPQYYPVKTLSADPGGSDNYYTQWLMQERAKVDAGMILNIRITSAGTGLTPNQTALAGVAVIKGDGAGATVTVNTGSSGELTAVNIVSRGTGYTWATISFTGSTATATVITGPVNGLGSDPVRDLNAFNTIVNTRFENSESGDFTTDNDYRRIGLIVNPLTFGSSTPYTNPTGKVGTILTLNTVTGSFERDQIIKVNDTGNQPYARVIDIVEGTGGDAGKVFVNIIRTKEEHIAESDSDAYSDFTVGDIVSVSTGGTGSGTIETITTPDIQPYSGQVMYIENRRQIIRNPDQIENITTVFEW